MKTLILGKNSYLSTKLKKKIRNSFVYSLSDKKLKNLNFDNTNVIINSFYSSLKLNHIDNYELFINKSIYELSKFLDLIKNYKVNQIIYTSSSSIYNSINEEDFTDERNRKLYASTKYNVENLLKNFCHKKKIKLCISRIFNIFGEEEKFSIISKIIDCYNKKKLPLDLINEGKSVRDFIHIDNVVQCYQQILKNKNTGIIDVGSGFGIKVIDIIEALGKKNFKIRYVKKNETNFSIAQNLRFKLFKRKNLENFLKKNLKLNRKIQFEKIFSNRKNFIHDYVPGSIIYGTGKLAKKLLKLYRETKNNDISYFVEDDPVIIKNNETIDGVKVISFKDLLLLSKHKIINNIIIAKPSLSLKNLEILSKKLATVSLNVSFFDQDYLGKKNYLNLSDLTERFISDLFKRRTKTKFNFIKNIKNKNILITGAGGSIGSELVKQSLIYGANVIALDHSELALYNLEKLINTQIENKKLKLILGSINDLNKLNNVKKLYKINIVLHAAAYKHVNILENNVSLAIKNNVFGTKNILDTFNEKKTQIVIISTDKAARPISVLGATKRLAEIVSQIYINSNEYKSKVKIVRFGNVFGSQGSAIELFIKQLNDGLPVTITDLKVKRFFMSIQEACNLVLNVTTFKQDKKIFILNMGKQILLKDIIFKLARIKNIDHKNVILKKIGLKKGEKLVEELSINKKFNNTTNKEIFLVNEPQYNKLVVQEFLKILYINKDNSNENFLKNLIFKFLKNEK